jgi:putative salt-induced outer membrane protein YdiY
MRFLLILLALTAAYADTVIVDSGDRLNGEIEKLENGKLSLKTSYAGTIRIDWDKVVEMDSAASYQVETETGLRLRGPLHRQGAYVVVGGGDPDNSPNQEAAAAVVTGIVRLENDETPGFWETLEGSVGVGYTFTRGNSDQTQASLAARGNYRHDGYTLRADLNSIFAEIDDAERQSRHALNTRFDRYLSPNSFAFAIAAFERNDRQQLDLRSRLGGGFGWKVIQERNRTFDLLGGFTLTNEQFRAEEGDPLPRKSTGEGLLGFEWRSSRLWGVELRTRLTAHPNLVQRGRYRIEYDSGAQIPLIAGITWDVSLFDRYDNNPPREELERNDYGMVSTLGFSF